MKQADPISAIIRLSNPDKHTTYEAVVGTCYDETDWFMSNPMGERRFFNKGVTFGDILKDFEITSKNDARKNKWDFPLEDGYSEYLYGKTKILILVWNPTHSNNCLTLGMGISNEDHSEN